MERELFDKSIYTLQAKSQLNSFDRKIISSLYQPIMGYEALALYFTLWSELETKISYTKDAYFSRLIRIMNMDLNRIKSNLYILEALSLIRTYYQEDDEYNKYLILINSPLTAHKFFNNPMLNSKFYEAMGDIEYQKTKLMYHDRQVPTDKYLDVSASFRDVFNSENALKLDNTTNLYKTYSYANIVNKDVDFDILKKQLKKYQLHFLLSNEDFKNNLEVLFLTYKITSEEVVEAIYELSKNDELTEEKLNNECKRLDEAKKYTSSLKLIYLEDKKAKNKYERDSVYHFVLEHDKVSKLDNVKLYDLEKILKENDLEYPAINKLIELTIDNVGYLSIPYFKKVVEDYNSKKLYTLDDVIKVLDRRKEKAIIKRIKDDPKAKSSANDWYNESEKLSIEEQEAFKKLYKR